jgi:hypothetical protein
MVPATYIKDTFAIQGDFPFQGINILPSHLAKQHIIYTAKD